MQCHKLWYKTLQNKVEAWEKVPYGYLGKSVNASQVRVHLKDSLRKIAFWQVDRQHFGRWTVLVQLGEIIQPERTVSTKYSDLGEHGIF